MSAEDFTLIPTLKSLIKQLHIFFVGPHLEYAVQVWDPYDATHNFLHSHTNFQGINATVLQRPSGTQFEVRQIRCLHAMQQKFEQEGVPVLYPTR